MFSSIVFAVVLETRNIYTAFILMIVLWLLKEIFNRLAGDTYAGIMLEPFGESAIQYYSKNWTIANRNILTCRLHLCFYQQNNLDRPQVVHFFDHFPAFFF
ncbi:MAG: hypothetical protein IPN33_17200 [Saprospiraceae bacterium]|nr:hypothetical protein [Saprospiraceae bacterium]